MKIEFCFCTDCLKERADRLNKETYRTDCRRFIRDVSRGYIECKGSRIDIAQWAEFFTERHLDDFVGALARAGMGSGRNSYVTAVRAAISLDGQTCQHCSITSVSGRALAKPRQGSVANTTVNLTDKSRVPPPGNTGTFTTGLDRSEYGYRIAHAQKSLSLVLKHMWCHGFLTTPPPVCVIDSKILAAAVALGGATHWISWTRVASLNAYREHLEICRCAAGAHQIAIWELFTFDQRELPDVLTDELLQPVKDSFLFKYSFVACPGSDRSRSIHGSLKDVHRSAFGRNPTWRVGISIPARALVHRRHDQLLIEIYGHYESGVRHTEQHFIEDIAHLVTMMNSEFEEYFR